MEGGGFLCLGVIRQERQIQLSCFAGGFSFNPIFRDRDGSGYRPEPKACRRMSVQPGPQASPNKLTLNIFLSLLNLFKLKITITKKIFHKKRIHQQIFIPISICR